MTPLPDDPPRGWRRVHRPDLLTSLPFYIVALFYATIVGIALTGGGSSLVGGVIVVLIFASWIYTIMRFGAAAEHQKGWKTPVMAYLFASALVPLAFWLGARGVAEMASGSFGPRAIGSIAGAAALLVLSLLVYGLARGRTARLRIVPEA
jgi:hypothetical protein